MIYGIGTDILNSGRIKKILNIYGDKFLNRFFSKEEIKLSKKKFNKFLFFSKRFAVKEAFWKAYSPKKNEILKFKDIEVISDNEGKPSVALLGDTYKLLNKIEKNNNSKFKFHVSISDEPPNVIAFVIISLARYK